MNIDEQFGRDMKFYELGKEHSKILIKTMMECISMSDEEKTFTKKQVLIMLRGLLDNG